MGQAASRVVHGRSAKKGIIVSFDALGTLYTFREPFAQQYLHVAQKCGLKEQLDADDISKAFKSSFTSYQTQYPNYGKGTLDSPRVWWENFIEDVFLQVTDRVPNDLGSALYEHFASGDAYKVYPDVRPFLDGIRALREGSAHPETPSLITGILTNSDPRVRTILQDLSLTAGDVSKSTLTNKASVSQIVNGPAEFRAPWTGAYDPQRDFDFLSTSYDSGFEKPYAGAFRDAEQQASIVLMGKLTQGLDHSLGMAGLKTAIRSYQLLNKSVDDLGEMLWIHVGDEEVKDVEGAKMYGFQALLIDRESKLGHVKERVTSLEELASVINVLAQESFGR